jgi:hypothetical protein
MSPRTGVGCSHLASFHIGTQVTPPLFCLVRAELGDTFVPCSFAMWTAFPPSDYCEGSVTIGFSTSRPSRLYAHETFGARRCPFVSLPELIVAYPSKRALAHLTPLSEYFNGVASGMLRRGYRCPVGNLGSSGRLTIRTGRGSSSIHIPSMISAFWPCSCPL